MIILMSKNCKTSIPQLITLISLSWFRGLRRFWCAVNKSVMVVMKEIMQSAPVTKVRIFKLH